MALSTEELNEAKEVAADLRLIEDSFEDSFDIASGMEGWGPVVKRAADLLEAISADRNNVLTLVDLVADAIAAVDDEGLTNMTWSRHARAAIRVVAEWVRANPGPNSAWPAVAHDLWDESNR